MSPVCPAKWPVTDGRLLNACSELFGVCGPSSCRTSDGQRSSQVAGERCHMLTRSRAEWPRFCVQPWLGAFSLRAGSRAEERGSRHRLIFLTCTCLNPTLQEAREQPLIERPRWSFFHFPPDFLNELLSVSRPLSQLWRGGGSCVDNSWGSKCVDVKTDHVVNLVFLFQHHELKMCQMYGGWNVSRVKKKQTNIVKLFPPIFN